MKDSEAFLHNAWIFATAFNSFWYMTHQCYLKGNATPRLVEEVNSRSANLEFVQMVIPENLFILN